MAQVPNKVAERLAAGIKTLEDEPLLDISQIVWRGGVASKD